MLFAVRAAGHQHTSLSLGDPADTLFAENPVASDLRQRQLAAPRVADLMAHPEGVHVAARTEFSAAVEF
jgi:hypothetical protein